MIEVKDLTIQFGAAPVVENVSFTIQSGEILGVVGESGSGKTMTALAVMGLLPEEAVIRSGSVKIDGTELIHAESKVLRSFQGNKMSMIFQEPMTSLNPTLKIGRQVGEVLTLHTDMKKKEIKAKVLDALKEVGLPAAEKIYESYPHRLSGGMRQRVMIAMSIILKSKLLVADEPTTALDITIQAQIMQLLKVINQENQTSILFITHDLNLMRGFCQRMLVMRQGQIVESGTVEEVFKNPKHEYTTELIQAIPTRAKRKRTEGSDADKSYETEEGSAKQAAVESGGSKK